MQLIRAVLLASVLTSSGCLPLPYPHKVVPHSNIEGRVVDAKTGSPIAGATVRLEAGGARARTGIDGSFKFVPEEEWRFFFVLPLVPVEFWWLCCGDRLSIEAAPFENVRYREETLEVDSCPVPLYMAYSRRENLEIYDDVGEIRLLRMPPRE